MQESRIRKARFVLPRLPVWHLSQKSFKLSLLKGLSREIKGGYCCISIDSSFQGQRGCPSLHFNFNKGRLCKLQKAFQRMIYCLNISGCGLNSCPHDVPLLYNKTHHCHSTVYDVIIGSPKFDISLPILKNIFKTSLYSRNTL